MLSVVKMKLIIALFKAYQFDINDDNNNNDDDDDKSDDRV
jgi:hypothetical protein